MTKTINGITYDTDRSVLLSCDSDYKANNVAIYRTRSGHFFLHTHSQCVDGKKVPWGVDMDDFAPGQITVQIDGRPYLSEHMSVKETIRPLTRQQALLWVLRRHVPKCFRQELRKKGFKL